MRALTFQPYLRQRDRWPAEGRVILAQYDPQCVVVYQAFKASTGHFAAAHNRFGDGFSLNRMSWIKPNFLWMMYRSSWGTAQGQECVLAIWLRREGFRQILGRFVHSTFVELVYGDPAAWKRALADSDVRLQWDPDHSPTGGKLTRRAIQLGLSGETLRQYVEEWIVEIQDISGFVREQSRYRDQPDRLMTPAEDVYPVADESIARRLGVA